MSDKALTWSWVFGWTCAISVGGLMNTLGMLPNDPAWWYLPSLIVLPLIVGYISYTEITRGSTNE